MARFVRLLLPGLGPEALRLQQLLGGDGSTSAGSSQSQHDAATDTDAVSAVAGAPAQQLSDSSADSADSAESTGTARM
jgi:hypothetical protein